MKRHFWALVMVLTGLSALPVLAVTAQAQRPGGPEGGFMRFDRVLSALDTNSDGAISASELDNATAALRKLDKNNDGKLTEDELRPNFPGGPGGPGVRGPGRDSAGSADDMVKTLMEFDRNGDGQLSKEEVPERMQGLFERADANKDSLLTREELKASAETRGNAGPGFGRGRPGEERGERGGRPEGFGPGGPGGMRTPSTAALDEDGDGTISDAELNNAPAALRKLDKNNDGNLTEEEVRPNFGGRRGPGGGRNPEEMINHLFEENDKNNDGKLSKDELPERMQAMLERADANKDGFLTKEEMKVFFESQGGGFGPGRPGGRDGEERNQRQRP